jgi:hypothetical protein
MADIRLLRWMQNLNQLMWDHEILYVDRSSEDEQLSTRQLFRKTKKTNMAGSWNLKCTYCFMGNSWTIALRQTKFGTVKDHGRSYILFESLFSLMELFNMAKVGFSNLRWCKNCTTHLGTLKFLMLTDLQRMNTLNKTAFAKNQKYECGGLLKAKIHILFYENNSWGCLAGKTVKSL